MQSPGLFSALTLENPLQIVGTTNAYAALLAQKAGFKAIYLSGAGVANCLGLPDLGITNLNDVNQVVQQITYACDLPLLVDIDTGWGSIFNIQRAIKTMIKSGAAGVHLEDQVQAKRCGHRPKKELVSTTEMCDRIKAALDAKYDNNFTVMARTDALAIEGLEETIERILAYVNVGANMIFLEGAKKLSDYQSVCDICQVPVLANVTEFGLTPLFSKAELQKTGVQLILYPLSAFRAMNAAAANTFETIRKDGSQKSLIQNMQTREGLYEVLNYHQYEKKLDELFAEGKEK